MRLSRSLIAVVAALALSACASRGTAIPGWVTFDDHTRYQARTISDSICDLSVAFERTAAFGGDAQSDAALAMNAFQQVALSLQKPSFDLHALEIVRRLSPNGVQIITVHGVVGP